MNATLWTILGSVFASLATFYSISITKRKVSVEADSVIVTSATGAVKLANDQLDRVRVDLADLRREVDAYRLQVQAATRAEVSLKKEVRRLRARVGDLEQFIMKSGLTIPAEDEDSGETTFPNQEGNHV